MHDDSPKVSVAAGGRAGRIRRRVRRTERGLGVRAFEELHEDVGQEVAVADRGAHAIGRRSLHLDPEVVAARFRQPLEEEPVRLGWIAAPRRCQDPRLVSVRVAVEQDARGQRQDPQLPAMRFPGELEDRAGAKRVDLDASFTVERPLDDGVQIERFVWHAEGPDALARAELPGAQFERLEHLDPLLTCRGDHPLMMSRLR